MNCSVSRRKILTTPTPMESPAPMQKTVFQESMLPHSKVGAFGDNIAKYVMEPLLYLWQHPSDEGPRWGAKNHLESRAVHLQLSLTYYPRNIFLLQIKLSLLLGVPASLKPLEYITCSLLNNHDRGIFSRRRYLGSGYNLSNSWTKLLLITWAELEESSPSVALLKLCAA